MVDRSHAVTRLITDGEVPAPNIGPRSIEDPVLGLGQDSYESYSNSAVDTLDNGMMVFAGPVDDPFFVDLGGIFDLGDAPRQDGDPIDGLACFNTNALVLNIPMNMLHKGNNLDNEDDDDDIDAPTSILDGDYVIGVWASASRPQVRVLQDVEVNMDTDMVGYQVTDNDYVMVSRLGMPLTNEAIIPVGMKDYWNSLMPYDELEDTILDQYFYNPELALYMDEDEFANAVPAFAPLRIQENSLGMFDFTNGADGLNGLTDSMKMGTALGHPVFGPLLLAGPGKPRSVDIWPIFHTGVPNLPPYQLATGKGGNPLAAGQPFINNFLPSGGDMLRLNMAVPPTPRDSSSFSSLGLIQATVLGLTDSTYMGGADSIVYIPNMDGFPNGRRLEDDVTRIELQAVSGVVLAAIGLWYDDYNPDSTASPVTDDLMGVLGYTTGIEENDKEFRDTFPYLALPHSAKGECSGAIRPNAVDDFFTTEGLGIDAPRVVGINFPNPFQDQTTIKLRVRETTAVNIDLYDVNGRRLNNLVRRPFQAGEHLIPVQVTSLPQGIYFAVVSNGSGEVMQTLRMVKSY